MSDEDDDLDSCWADVRGPLKPRPPKAVEAELNLSSTHVPDVVPSASFGYSRGIYAVWVGLFTRAGEVSAVDYRRIQIRMQVDADGITLHTIQFPVAQDTWGRILTLGIFNEPTGGQGSFFLDMQVQVDILPGDSVSISEAHIPV